jgi:hypothetical protein
MKEKAEDENEDDGCRLKPEAFLSAQPDKNVSHAVRHLAFAAVAARAGPDIAPMSICS